MIIWKGYGILAIFIPFAIAMLFQLLFGEETLYSGLGYLVGGIIIWVLGKKLNSNNEKIVIDPKTGLQSIQRTDHWMLWIKMELWTPIFVILGACIALSNMTGGRSDDFAFPLIAMVFLFYIASFLFLKRNKLKSASFLKTRSIKPELRLRSKSVVKDDNVRNLGLSEEEKRKKEFYEEIRKNRNKVVKSEPTDHSKYLPK